MARTVKPHDALPTKIAKYTPAEALTAATGFFAVFSLKGNWIFFAVGVFAVLNVAYLVAAAKTNETEEKPNFGFYPLAFVAFILWALAMIDQVGDSAGLGEDNSDPRRAYVLAFAAFAIPLLDTLLVVRKRDWRQPAETKVDPVAEEHVVGE